MRHPNVSTFILSAILVCWQAGQTNGNVHGQSNSQPQNAGNQPVSANINPLKSLTRSFPKSVSLKENGHLLEFCPDYTCDAFVSSASVPPAELRDFAYLYIYYFSDFVYLPDWRSQPEAKSTAMRVLSNPEYRNCKKQSDQETARCVLLERSGGGRIKLIFVRYDENERNVVPLDIDKEISKTAR